MSDARELARQLLQWYLKRRSHVADMSLNCSRTKYRPARGLNLVRQSMMTSVVMRLENIGI